MNAQQPFLWLIKLRWGALLSQVALLAGVQVGLSLSLPLLPLAVILALELSSNLALTAWARRHAEVSFWVTGLITAADLLLFTALLYFSGGAYNPFSFLYLVYLSLAAVMLPPRWTWGLVVLAVGAFGLLFVLPDPAGAAEHAGHLGHEGHAAMGAGNLALHLQGMWVAFAVASGFIVYFVQKVTRALAAREQELAEARARTARTERLAGLATLAAGAAHELSTPLSTIAVVARELERDRDASPATVVEDARLIREEVERCKGILRQMSTDAGSSLGEAPVATSGQALLAAALENIPGRERVQVDAASVEWTVPPRAMAQALRGVLKNALEASRAGAVRVTLQSAPDAARATVQDEGPGMPPEVLSRAGEPFFTTKAPGEGMGLGLFLSRAVLEQLGGRLELDSALGRGTTATLVLPSSVHKEAAAR